MVDAGTPATGDVVLSHVDTLAPDEREFELLIVSHVDSDHIGGVLPVLRDDKRGLRFNDVWFNGRHHLTESFAVEGVDQGNELSALLADLPWNEAWGRAAVVVPEAGPLPSRQLAGGLSLTLLLALPRATRSAGA